MEKEKTKEMFQEFKKHQQQQKEFGHQQQP